MKARKQFGKWLETEAMRCRHMDTPGDATTMCGAPIVAAQLVLENCGEGSAMRVAGYCVAHIADLWRDAQRMAERVAAEAAVVTAPVTTPDPEPVLCYVDGPWAYFTTQALSEQGGDDWNDAPYQHNAGDPYEPCGDQAGAWRIVRVAFEPGIAMSSPADTEGRYSVDDVNARLIPWLAELDYRACRTDPRTVIWAGTTLSQFIAVIQATGGHVYLESPRVGGAA